MDEMQVAEQKRAVLRNVAAYRDLCRQVRGKSTGGLVFGAIMLGLWYLIFGQRNDYGIFSLIYLGLAALEFSSALWNRISPSAEGVLIDGLVLLAFGGATFARQFLIWQGQVPGRVTPWLLLFGAYWLYAGFNHLKEYAQLRRAFAHRPTREHLRWFDGLIREVHEADPVNDPTALDLPTRPPVRGKLLGDTAIFLQAGSDDPLIVAREDVEIERAASKDPDRPPVGYLILEDVDYGGFPLDPENWRNYETWKIEGGQPPPPVVRPRQRADD